MRMSGKMSRNQKIAVLTGIALACMGLVVGAFYLLESALVSMKIDVSPGFFWILQTVALFLCYGYFAKLILAEVRKKP